jgi:hypothetical protein
MSNLDSILTELRSERDRLNHAIAALEGIGSDHASYKPTRRKLSAAGRARIAASQRARWAKFKAGKKK